MRLHFLGKVFVSISALVFSVVPWLAAQTSGGTTGAIPFGPDGPL
jgi:hypothetical protein